MSEKEKNSATEVKDSNESTVSKIKNTKNKVSLKQLIEKKLEKDGRKIATKDIYIESMDGCITFNNPSDSARIEYSEKAKSGSYVDMIDGMIKLIYDCCPMLHSKELQESIEVEYPYDTVKAVFDIDEILEIGTKLINFFKDENTEDEVKAAEEKLKN